MSTVMGYKECKQCGYEFGVYEFDCRTNEWEFDCLRCGYTEFQQWITAPDRTRIGWKHEILDGYGAVWATPRVRGVSTSFGLHTPSEVEDRVQKIRTAIAEGQLDPYSSYVTQWNSELKRAELVVGTWCQDGDIFGGDLPFDMTKFPVDLLAPDER